MYQNRYQNQKDERCTIQFLDSIEAQRGAYGRIYDWANQVGIDLLILPRPSHSAISSSEALVPLKLELFLRLAYLKLFSDLNLSLILFSGYFFLAYSIPCY